MSESAGSDLESTVTEFVELEQELGARSDDEPPKPEQSPGEPSEPKMYGGTIVDGQKVAASDVPADYPVPVETTYALRLDVRVEPDVVLPTYQEWPGTNEDSDHVEQLLDALGRDEGEFANVYGDEVALDTENGWHGIDVERTRKLRTTREARNKEWFDRGRKRIGAALVAGVIGSMLVSSPLGSFGSLLTIASWVLISALLYCDGKRLADATDWEYSRQEQLLGLIPLVNVGFGAAYLLNRRLQLSNAEPAETTSLVTKALGLGSVGFVFEFALVDVVTNLGMPLLLYGWVFLAMAVYFDTHYVLEKTDWVDEAPPWVLLTALFGPLGAIGHVSKRRSKFD